MVEHAHVALCRDEVAARLAAGSAGDVEPGGDGQLDGRETHAARGAVDQDALAGGRGGALEQRTVRGAVGDAEGRALGVREIVRQRPHVLFATERELRVGPAERARQVDAFAGVDAGAGAVGAGSVGEGGQFAVEARPHVRLVGVHTRRLHTDEDFALDGRWLRQFLDDEDVGVTEFVDADRTHGSVSYGSKRTGDARQLISGEITGDADRDLAVVAGADVDVWPVG